MDRNVFLYAYSKVWSSVLAAISLGIFSILPTVTCADSLDQYGAFTSLHVTPTGYFTKAQFGNRWLFVDPLGNAYFGKAVDLINDVGESWGNVIKYTTVYAYDKSTTTYSLNLNVKAEDLFPNDVVNDHGATITAHDDTIYIGYGRPFNDTYFNVSTLGQGGKIQWYYSTGNGSWNLINGSGNPAGASKLNSDGSYNLDTGNWIVPDSNGFYNSNYQPNGNLVTWWKAVYASGGYTFFPSDFAPTTLPNDSSSLYYIKGVVTTAFATAPKVAQLYDETFLYNAVPIKYSSQSGPTDYLQNWFAATIQRMRAWGLNLAGDYSDRYWEEAPLNPNNRYPEIQTYQMSGDSMELRYFPSQEVKGIYDGGECNGGGIYPGVQPDVFDPLYASNMSTDAVRAIVGNSINDPWTVAINPEEADYLFGLDSNFNHENAVFAVIAANPYHPTGTDPLGNAVTYTDTHLYSKYALRDYLRYAYKDPSDPLLPFTINSNVLGYTTYSKSPSGLELTALHNLNAAWGTHYTTWDTTGSGDADSTGNAWSTGTGFMDEAGMTNAWGIFQYITNGCSGLYYKDFATPSKPAIATDFTSFLGFFTQRYASVLHNAVNAVTPRTLIALFIYDPPAVVAQELSSYVDALEVSPSYDPVNSMQRIMDNFNGPLIYHDYQQSNLDSPIDYGGAITAVTYDGTNTTIKFDNGVPYEMRFAMAPQFPDSSGCPAYPRTVSAQWTTILVAGDYSGCLQPGQQVRMNADSSWVGHYQQGDSQAIRAQDMVTQYNEFINQSRSDGVYDIAGVSHWGWWDDSQLDGSEQGQFGLVTQWDNAYDGVEDQVAAAKDANGRFIGGEARNYGNAISTLSAFWNRLNNSSNLPGIGPATGPQASFTFAPASPAVGNPVQFTDTSNNDPTSWSWDFGDNTGASTLESPAHAYTAVGTYTVTLTATNSSGSSQATHDVTVGEPSGNTTSFTFSPTSPASGQAVQFTDTSTDKPISWSWNFGDSASGQANTSALQNPTHTYAANGTYTVTLTVGTGSQGSVNGGGGGQASESVIVSSGSGG